MHLLYKERIPSAIHGYFSK